MVLVPKAVAAAAAAAVAAAAAAEVAAEAEVLPRQAAAVAEVLLRRAAAAAEAARGSRSAMVTDWALEVRLPVFRVTDLAMEVQEICSPGPLPVCAQETRSATCSSAAWAARRSTRRPCAVAGWGSRLLLLSAAPTALTLRERQDGEATSEQGHLAEVGFMACRLVSGRVDGSRTQKRARGKENRPAVSAPAARPHSRAERLRPAPRRTFTRPTVAQAPLSAPRVRWEFRAAKFA